MELIASTNSTPTGRSVSCSGTLLPLMLTVGPNGMTLKARNAGMAEITGARMYTGRSASAGMMSSFSASLMPSARPCSTPPGPTRFGPTRCCIRATTRRSAQMVIRVRSTSSTKTNSALPTVT